MDNNNQVPQQTMQPVDPNVVQEEKKPERVDELDIIGGGIFKLIQTGFTKIKELVSPKKVQ